MAKVFETLLHRSARRQKTQEKSDIRLTQPEFSGLSLE